MTDITDQDRRQLRDDAKAVINKTAMRSSAAVSIAQYVLATVDAPAPTLAEELRSWVEDASYDEDRDNLRHAADRAEQMEQGLAEARAEVERLTAENEKLRRTDNYREFREFLGVQKGAESNAESLNPADVPPGEAWLVDVGGERRNAVKNNDGQLSWVTVNANGWFDSEDNEDVTLVERLTPKEAEPEYPTYTTPEGEVYRIYETADQLPDTNESFRDRYGVLTNAEYEKATERPDSRPTSDGPWVKVKDGEDVDGWITFAHRNYPLRDL